MFKKVKSPTELVAGVLKLGGSLGDIPQATDDGQFGTQATTLMGQHAPQSAHS